jgi:hypothetical protein
VDQTTLTLPEAEKLLSAPHWPTPAVVAPAAISRVKVGSWCQDLASASREWAGAIESP